MHFLEQYNGHVVLIQKQVQGQKPLSLSHLCKCLLPRFIIYVNIFVYICLMHVCGTLSFAIYVVLELNFLGVFALGKLNWLISLEQVDIFLSIY